MYLYILYIYILICVILLFDSGRCTHIKQTSDTPVTISDVFSDEDDYSIWDKKFNERRIDFPQFTNPEKKKANALHQKNKVSSERRAQTEAPQKANQNIPGHYLPTADWNSLGTYTENDNLVHPLLSRNLSLAGKEKQSQNREVLQPLPSNEEPALPFNPLGSRIKQDIRHRKYHLRETTSRQKQKNMTEMGYVLLCLHTKLFTNH